MPRNILQQCLQQQRLGTAAAFVVGVLGAAVEQIAAGWNTAAAGTASATATGEAAAETAAAIAAAFPGTTTKTTGLAL